MRTYRYDRRLQWSECDPAGIIFFPHYAIWMVEGLNEMFLSLGIDPHAIVDDQNRHGLPSVQLSMQFYKAPKLHETVIHEIRIEKIGDTSITVGHRFYLGDTLCMEAVETRVWSTYSLTYPSTLNSLSVPDEVRALLSNETEQSGA